jgi:hypothetical protein
MLSFKQPAVYKYFFTLFLSVFSAVATAQVKPLDIIPPQSPTSGCTGTPGIVAQPQSQFVCAGSTALFIGGATPWGRNLWQRSTDGGTVWETIPGTDQYTSGAGEDTLVVENISIDMNGYKYRWVVYPYPVSCNVPAYSLIATLSVSAQPNLGDDSAVTVNCQECTANIAPLYNTASYSSASWNTANAYAAAAGNYTLTVTDGGICTDQANVSVNFTDGLVTRLCRNGMARLVSDITGSTYQWQQSNASGTFLDLNGASTGRSIKLTSVIFYGGMARFRCKVNGVSFSSIYTLRATSLWSGNADNNWGNAANWGCRVVPDSFTDVVINAGTVVVNVNAAVNTLTIKPGVNFSVAPGVTLTVLH